MSQVNLRHTFILFFILLAFTVRGQAPVMHAKPGMGAGKFNYSSFTPASVNNTPQAAMGNKGQEAHPEYGLLCQDAPCTNCYEMIGKRTATTKTFISNNDASEVYTQTSTAPMHYMDDAGRWRTINKYLRPTAATGVFAATEQEAPVVINTANGGFVTLGKEGAGMQFNNNLELLYERPDGTTQNLGPANWTSYTAGDNGVYVTDAWPGIDIEMRVSRGAVKTNFWINRAMPEYATGKLLVRDHMHLADGYSLYTQGQERYTGTIEVRNAASEKQYIISAATAFEKNNGVNTLRNLEYRTTGNNIIDIAVPGDFLNRPAASYPVIIDPLVSLATSVAVAGSSYSPLWTIGCPILNPATVPADLTISDIQFTFEYLASGGALMVNGAMDFTLGTCRNPALGGWYWYCLDFTPGNCGGTNTSLISDLMACVPPVNCASYDLDITMNFYQNYTSVTPCTNMYITATMPLTITVVGHTLDMTTSASASAVCPGQPVTISTNTSYGKTPYSYSWSPGGASTPSITVSPASTTTYTAVVTDACGFQDTSYSTITVYPQAPVAGTTTVCQGTSTTLTNAVPGGTWSTGDPAIATVASSGMVTGLTVGSTVISYTTVNGCVTTALFTVVSTPAPVTGNDSLCTGNSITLSDVTPGGTWTSSNPAVAIVGSTGVVTALTAGSATITYAMSASCYRTFSLLSFLTPAITLAAQADPSGCLSFDGSITLGGLTPGNSYTVNYLFNGAPAGATLTANAGGMLIITGLDGGIYNNFLVTSAAGCISNPIPGPVVLNLPPLPATPVVTSNGPLCAGDILSLTATCATTGVTYNWSGPGGFTATEQNPSVGPVSAASTGVYQVSTIYDKCVSAPSSTLVIVHPIPVISGITSINPSVCHAADGSIILSGLTPGVIYTVSYTVNGVPVAPITIAADGSGNITITGLTAGTYAAFGVTAFSCPSAVDGSVTLVDPGAPPPAILSSNAPVCEGATLSMYATDSVPGLNYSWTGPAGFSSNAQNPFIYNPIQAFSGIYTVVATNASCSAWSTIGISIFPAVTLVNVTADQTIIYGASVWLTADGALYYTWSPADGSLSNPDIRNPIARPLTSTTYIVTGMNQWGCVDTAAVRITVGYTDSVIIPTAFTPNADGYNDVFRIANAKDCKLVSFSVYNRWGEEIYQNTWDIASGWDGTHNGVPADMGVYHYMIIVARPNGENKVYAGDVTLIR